jgi:hypothetical protein
VSVTRRAKPTIQRYEGRNPKPIIYWLVDGQNPSRSVMRSLPTLGDIVRPGHTWRSDFAGSQDNGRPRILVAMGAAEWSSSSTARVVVTDYAEGEACSSSFACREDGWAFDDLMMCGVE